MKGSRFIVQVKDTCNSLVYILGLVWLWRKQVEKIIHNTNLNSGQFSPPPFSQTFYMPNYPLRILLVTRGLIREYLL